jgi:myotubularin-related protein 14
LIKKEKEKKQISGNYKSSPGEEMSCHALPPDDGLQNLTRDDLRTLLHFFFTKSANLHAEMDSNAYLGGVLSRCEALFRRDYAVTSVDNAGGALCSSYPARLLLPLSPVASGGGAPGCCCGIGAPSEAASSVTAAEMRSLWSRSRVARVRTRFPVPVMLVKGRLVCRSSTLSHSVEAIFQGGLGALTGGGGSGELQDNGHGSGGFTGGGDGAQRAAAGGISGSAPLDNGCRADASSSVGAARNSDIAVLVRLKIDSIVDLMVEDRKVRYGVYVCSSEKADTHSRYVSNGFKMLALPYPGVEFFRVYRDHDHNPLGLVFPWGSSAGNATLSHNSRRVLEMTLNYRSKDIVDLTACYLRVILDHLANPANPNGLDLHCIQGWDRTPMFVSLLRMSLWADGVVHQSLGFDEILYLTLAYDWMLFGHHLIDRTSRGEDILHFCFNFLKYLCEESFSFHRFEHAHRAAGGNLDSLGLHDRSWARPGAAASSSTADGCSLPSAATRVRRSVSQSEMRAPQYLGDAEFEIVQEYNPEPMVNSFFVLVEDYEQAGSKRPGNNDIDCPAPAKDGHMSESAILLARAMSSSSDSPSGDLISPSAHVGSGSSGIVVKGNGASRPLEQCPRHRRLAETSNRVFLGQIRELYFDLLADVETEISEARLETGSSLTASMMWWAG